MKFKDNDMKHHSLIKAKENQKCIVCGDTTNYIDYCCEGALCSTECQDKYYKILEKDLNKKGE